MIEKGNIETFFTTIDASTIIIQNELNITYLDALILTGQLLFQGNIHEPLSDISAKKLKIKL
ncbi:hypothetical protein KHA80_16185 [Anaerobacillus sp. HL2]|nr:hypothetical protein KHA80_16185 [Anaerobacillus sp. HL2]